MRKIIFQTLIAALVVIPLSAIPFTAIAAFDQESFDSPDDAVLALQSAAAAQDETKLAELFGAQFLEQIRSGDSVADKLQLQRLAERMTKSKALKDDSDGGKIIEVGEERWPFPAPLIKVSDQWYFDSIAGAEEVINRRVGENELRAIKVAQFYVDAQRLYKAKDRTGSGPQFAQKLTSSPERKDGLYWPESGGDTSPFGPLVSLAHAQGYGEQDNGAKETSGDPVFHGYRYRILAKQGEAAPGGKKSYLDASGAMTGGFALLAYPSRYGVSGVMSFMIGADGKIYEKSLGEETERAASAITEFNPDAGWRLAEISG